MSEQSEKSEIQIKQLNEHEYRVENLPRGESVWVQVDCFDVNLKRTDEGLVVDVYGFNDQDRGESLASLCAFDSDTLQFDVEGESWNPKPAKAES